MNHDHVFRYLLNSNLVEFLADSLISIYSITVDDSIKIKNGIQLSLNPHGKYHNLSFQSAHQTPNGVFTLYASTYSLSVCVCVCSMKSCSCTTANSPQCARSAQMFVIYNQLYDAEKWAQTRPKNALRCSAHKIHLTNERPKKNINELLIKVRYLHFIIGK